MARTLINLSGPGTGLLRDRPWYRVTSQHSCTATNFTKATSLEQLLTQILDKQDKPL